MKILIWVGAVLVVWAGLALAMNMPRELRLRRLARSRSGTDSFGAFRQSLAELPEDVVTLVYRRVQPLVASDFPLQSTDKLLETLEIDQGALDELIEELTAPSDRAPGPTMARPITTVADLARAVHDRRRG